ncbi:MAG: aminotransferase class IV [Armatimonadota bacterium]|nr:MAG: aminotransferase class IV [Armatimonadota bacterium]
MPDVVYLNGRIVPPSEAVISVNDRGFLFGDSVYEVLRSYGGRLWALNRHLRRLARSLAAIDLHTVDLEEVRAAIEETYRASSLPDAVVYLQITRGVAPRAHAYPRDLQPTVVITVRDVAPALASIDFDGVAAVTAPDLRWRRCDIKSTNLLPNVLAKTRAHDHGVDEAILIDAEECVTEGSSTSVFWVAQNRLFTTPAGPEILPGITRELIAEIAREEGIPLLAERVRLDQFRRASEVFLAGTVHEVCPVIRLDDAPVGSGRAGPLTLQLQKGYRARVAAGDDELR